MAFYTTERGEDVHISRLCSLLISNMLEATQERIYITGGDSVKNIHIAYVEVTEV